LKSQRAVSSILTLFGIGGASLRQSSVSSVIRSMRSVMLTALLPAKKIGGTLLGLATLGSSAKHQE
jgi:hypothetical protein